ncbi:MAG: ROK family protein [Ignavibacteria bacterium]|nr:ROK family protein [Ignavibacteria bacterium]MCU7502682.1 ROK family protein [Ignavibacteria bacterium]MCU7515115.1 ROK family protein [Ignavibacteria bacterium]
MAVIAIDLISTGLTSAALGNSGKVLYKETLSIEGLKGTEVSRLIKGQITKILNIFKNRPIQIKSAGISVPGIYNSKTGCVWAPNIEGWDEYPLKQDMKPFLIEHGVNVKIANNRTCYILGEMWLGAAQKSRNAIYLSIGKGIGAGILVDGNVLHGFNDGVGAAGWLALSDSFHPEFKLRGSFEYLASGRGILNSTRALLSKKKDSMGILAQKNPDEITLMDIFEAYRQKDPTAKKVLQQSRKYWGMAAANLISLFNPELIIFGGSLFGPAQQFLDEIKAETARWAQPLFMKNVKILGSQLGSNAGLIGAGHLAMKKF